MDSSSRGGPTMSTRFKVDGPIIVGAGPSGLAVAACLAERSIPSLLLEKSHCIASLWQERAYDRLKLHLPRKFCELPLMAFPRNFPKYPTKTQFIAYINSYAERFRIKPRFEQAVQTAEFDEVNESWIVRTGDKEYQSRWLVVATGENADPVVPEVPGIEKFSGRVVHTCAYKSGSEYKNQTVLVIGCGNSGMEVSLDLCNYNAYPHLVIRNSVHILPREMLGVSTFAAAMALLKWFPLRLVDKLLLLMARLTLGDTDRFGIRRPKTGPIELKNSTGKTPVLDVGALSKIKAGKIKVTAGLKKITSHGAEFVDGREERFDSIILATGYKSNVPIWLKGCGFFTEEGMPKKPFSENWKGENGLYAVGFSRRGLLGSSFDAINIANDVEHQWKHTQKLRVDNPISSVNRVGSG